MIRPTTMIIIFFVIAQLLGIYVGSVIIKDVNSNPYVSSMVVTSDANDASNAIVFMLYILLGAVMMIVLIKFKLPAIILRVMEFLLIASASSIVFYAFFRIFTGYDISTTAGIIFGLVFSGVRIALPYLKNAAAILATAGVGVIFGISLGVLPALVFLILLAIYDFLAVFITKHMVEMAKFVVEKDLAFTITAKSPSAVPGKKEDRIDLGTGDMIAPIMLEVSVLSWNPIAALFVFVGASVSLLLFLNLVWKKKMVLPALPPIVAGMIVALVIGFVVKAF
ncbi:hypothetical protein HY988_00635 [Candidatus Micrarchaeota archaeon]|nr:hypothetical protein [Candidatus Micrarchaeota archaeon]